METTNPTTSQDPTLALIGHGHVRPNVNGFVARCGGPGMCSQCREEAIALPRAQITFTRTLNPPEQPFAYPLHYTVTGKWEGDPQAAIEIVQEVWDEATLQPVMQHWGLYAVKRCEESHTILYLSTQNHGVPLVVKCIQHKEGWIPDVEVVAA